MLTMDRLSFSASLVEELPESTVTLYHGDARNLDRIQDDSIDLIATHPPYANIIRYSPSTLSRSKSPYPLPSRVRVRVNQTRLL